MSRNLWGRWLAKLARGPSPGPVVQFGSLPEDYWLAHQRLHSTARSQAPVAGEFGRVGLSNPTGSGVLLVVEGMKASTSLAAGMTFHVALAADLSGTLTGATTQVRDTRWPLGQSVGSGTTSRAILGSDTNAAAQHTTNVVENSVTVAQNIITIFQCPPVVLSPGFTVVIEGQSVQAAIFAWFKWREFLGAEIDDLV